MWLALLANRWDDRLTALKHTLDATNMKESNNHGQA